VIARLHAIAYFLPGLVLGLVVFTFHRWARRLPPEPGDDAPPETEPRWARRYLRVALVILTAATLELLVLAGALASIVLRGSD
jgi:hypothetical protein